MSDCLDIIFFCECICLSGFIELHTVRVKIIVQFQVLMAEEKFCVVCKGKGAIELLDSQCPFCNGTGENSKSAESYLLSHICQCIFLDRKMCPICEKKCHHDTPNRPKVLVNPM